MGKRGEYHSNRFQIGMQGNSLNVENIARGKMSMLTPVLE